MHFERDIHSFIATHGLDLTLKKFGLKDVVMMYGAENLINEYDLVKLVVQYSLEEVEKVLGKTLVKEVYGEDYPLYVEPFLVGSIAKKFGVNLAIDAYNRVEISKDKLIAVLKYLEREIGKLDNEHEMRREQFEEILQLVDAAQPQSTDEKKLGTSTNWSFGFSLDGPRLLIRTFFQKMVFDIGSSVENQPILPPEVRTIYNQEYPRIKLAKIPIVFCGTARTPIDEAAATLVIRQILQKYPPDKYCIVTGGYPAGIPFIAATVAKELGFETSAVIPAVIHHTSFDHHRELYDQVFEVGQDWGDETYTLASISCTDDNDGETYCIGGGFWTEIEYFACAQLLRKIYVVQGFPGVSSSSAIAGEHLETIDTPYGDYHIKRGRNR